MVSTCIAFPNQQNLLVKCPKQEACSVIGFDARRFASLPRKIQGYPDWLSEVQALLWRHFEQLSWVFSVHACRDMSAGESKVKGTRKEVGGFLHQCSLPRVLLGSDRGVPEKQYVKNTPPTLHVW
eukprot:402305-Pleurochrysis_carterae.AAC.2